MKKLEMFDNSFRLVSAILTIADTYQRTVKLRNDLPDFNDTIREEDVSVIAATLWKEKVRAFTISGFNSNLGEELIAF